MGRNKKPPMTRGDREGYDRIVKCFYKDGKKHGAKTRFGIAIGVSRAVIDRWGKYGIPRKYADAIHRATGLTRNKIWSNPAEWVD